MRQAPSEGTASGASVRGAPTRSARGRVRKREGGQEMPGVSVEIGVEEVDVWLGVGVAVRLEEDVAVWLEERVAVRLIVGVAVDVGVINET